MIFDEYLAQRVAEIDERIQSVVACARVYKVLFYAMRVPQIILSVSITATSLADLVDAATARRVLASLGIAHLLIEALVHAVPCAKRVAELEQERRTLVCLRNELAVARTHELSGAEKQRLVGRYAAYVTSAEEVIRDVVIVSD